MDINYLAVVAAALSSFLLGGLWYSPLAFLHSWNRAMGRDETGSSGHPAPVFGLSFVFAFVAALAFAALLIDGGYHIGQFVLYAVVLGLWH